MRCFDMGCLLAIAAIGCSSSAPGPGDGGAGGGAGGCTVGCASPIASTFDADAEGWSLQGFDSDNDDYSVSTSLQAPAIHDVAGGKPGGAIMRNETFYGIADYFQAPSKYLGDLSAYAGGTLSFDVRPSEVAPPFAAPLLLLASGAETWRYDGPGGPAAEMTWVTLTVPLAAGSGWTRVGDGAPATAAAFDAALANVKGLWLRAEFSDSIDESWFDNVSVSPPQ